MINEFLMEIISFIKLIWYQNFLWGVLLFSVQYFILFIF